MKSIEIKVEKRETVGKKSARILRKNEKVPCVIYDKDENISFFGHENQFRKVINTPDAYVVRLDFGDRKIDAIIKDIQFHPVSDRITHIDFMKIFDDVPFKIAIPVILEGFPVGVKEGGKLSLEHRRIMVKALLKDMPDHLYLNVENLELGKVLRIKDLQFDNLEIITPLNTVVASVKLTRSSKGMEAEEEAAAAAAAEATAAEGATSDKAETEKE